MSAAYVALTDQLAERFADLSEAVESHILAEMISGGDTFYAYRFEADIVTMTGLVAALRSDRGLWTDFQCAVEGFRPSTHWTVLLEHVYTLGNVQGKLKLLEQGISCPSEDDRREVAAYLNRLDGEVATLQELADRRGLAMRVNRAAGFPLINGLTMRGLTFVLGDDVELWHAFRSLVAVANEESARRCPVNDTQP